MNYVNEKYYQEMRFIIYRYHFLIIDCFLLSVLYLILDIPNHVIDNQKKFV